MRRKNRVYLRAKGDKKENRMSKEKEMKRKMMEVRKKRDEEESKEAT